jgi:alpha-glucosidase
MRVQQLVLGLVTLAGYVIAAPAPLVKKTDSSITADLTLAGDACDVYSADLKDLKLLVEYQTSKSKPIQPYGRIVDAMLYILVKTGSN